MSMLTPPGMGGKYRIKGDRYPRMRRSRGRGRVIAASVAAVVAIAVIGWGTLQLVDIFSGGKSTAAVASGGAKPGGCASASSSASSPPSVPGSAKDAAAKDDKDSKDAGDGKKDKGEDKGEDKDKADGRKSGKPEPGTITVNVLNATSKSGLAKTTSKELKKRGFKIGKVGNAPAELDKKVKDAGVLVAATGSDSTARLKVLNTQLDAADTRYDERKGDDVDLVIGNDFKKLDKQKAATKALAELTAPSRKPSADHC